MKPGVILLDEPSSALDPIASYKIEELLLQLKDEYTVVIVTHNMQQARRVADKTAFFSVDISKSWPHRAISSRWAKRTKSSTRHKQS